MYYLSGTHIDYNGDRMNYIWSGMIIISFICAIVTGRVDATVNAIFEGAQTAVSTMFSFAGAMCFWTGIMKIAEVSGVSEKINKLLSPVVKKLFPDATDKAREYATLNITANLLGMGNAATPMGIMAAQEMDKANPTPHKPSKDMCMLVALNTTAFQLIPSTIIALRAGAMSQSPTSIIVPIWFASGVGVVCAVMAVKLFHKIKRLL